jgi:hypothetical protein
MFYIDISVSGASDVKLLYANPFAAHLIVDVLAESLVCVRVASSNAELQLDSQYSS